MSWLVAAPDFKRSVVEALRQRLCSSDRFTFDTISLSHTPFESRELDALLNGGIPTGMITELAGAYVQCTRHGISGLTVEHQDSLLTSDCHLRQTASCTCEVICEQVKQV